MVEEIPLLGGRRSGEIAADPALEDADPADLALEDADLER